MATYRKPASTETDPQAPITSALMKALDDNVDAVTEGATGAPRVRVGALQRVTAGTSVRARRTALTTTASTTAIEHQRFNFLQAGTIRAQAQYRRINASGGSGVMTVNHVRGDTVTQIGQWTTTSTTFVTQSADVTVLPGDWVQITINSNNAGQTVEMQNSEFATNGEDLYPGSAAYLTGNTFNS